LLAMDVRALHLPSKYALPLTTIASKLRSYTGIRCFAPFLRPQIQWSRSWAEK